MKIEIEIDNAKIVELWQTMLDSQACGYWAMLVESDALISILAGHGSATFAIRDEGMSPRKLTGKSIRRGITGMLYTCPRHFANWIDGRADADTADAFVQCCLFGEVLYG